MLPVVTSEDGWTSPQWRFRRGRLVLTGGTSAVGLRLPLDAISWTDPEYAGEPSYLEAGPPLEAKVPTVTVCDPEGVPTTALAFEARDGHVHVFLPPTERLEDYADLLRLVEVAARKLAVPVVLEGYAPPPDPRLTQLVVTPDPGVIEVNVQPTRSWAEQRDLTTTLYAAARAEGLTTEKFDLDGSHTGTGGGNHLTLGGRRAGRLAAAAPARPARQPGVVLAAPPLALLPLLRPVHRPDQPGAAVRRGPARGRLRDGDRARRDRPADRDRPTRASRGRGSSTAPCGTCSPT